LSNTPLPFQSWSVGSYPKIVPLPVAATIPLPVAATIPLPVAATIPLPVAAITPLPVAASIAPPVAAPIPQGPTIPPTQSQPLGFLPKSHCEVLSPIYQMILLYLCSGAYQNTEFLHSNGTLLPTRTVRSGGQTELSYSPMMLLETFPQNLKRANALLHQMLRIGPCLFKTTLHRWAFMRDRSLIHLNLANIGKPPLLYGEIELAETGSGLMRHILTSLSFTGRCGDPNGRSTLS
jgi:hypothetical protein